MKDLVTEIRLWPPKNRAQTKVLASGYFVVGGKIKITMAVIHSVKRDAPWVVLPYHKDDAGNSYNDVEAVNRENGEALKALILTEYTKLKEEQGSFDQTGGDGSMGEEKPWE